ncbi:MAG: IPT/TIG domain-containing protein [Deltaproteobacteria bacterium]
MKPAAAVVLLSITFGAAPVLAQQIPTQCGPDCSRVGQYVLCNDDFDNSAMTAGGVRIDWLEAVCASFDLPEPSFGIEGFVALLGDGEQVVSLMQTYEELGRDRPGELIVEQGVALPFSAQAGFVGFLHGTRTSTVAFRICLKQQVEDPGANMFIRPFLFDADGVQGNNSTFIPVKLWDSAEDRGIPGDFVIRAIVTLSDHTPWEPGGECDMSGRDGGVNNPMRDAGPGGRRDGGPGRDAGPGGGDPDAGGVDGGNGNPGGAPTISAISPDEGRNVAPVDVIVTGTNFEAGLTLRIGSIDATGVDVPGATTITARVPANIAVGVYDVIVTNPDGQSAILANGYTVLDADGNGPPVADTCGCRTSGSTRGDSTWMLAFAVVALMLRRRRA